MKILAIDDDPVSLQVLESALDSLGHQTVLARDGEAAWGAMDDRSLRIVVCDWQLPGLDGLQLCHRVRHHRDEYVCFILLTERSATDENLERAFAAGVDDFLTKPVRLRELKLRLHVAQRTVKFTTEMRRLESFLPICSYCRKVRDDHDYWKQLEIYLNERVGTKFSHGICPACYEDVVAPKLREMGIPDTDLPPPA